MPTATSLQTQAWLITSLQNNLYADSVICTFLGAYLTLNTLHKRCVYLQVNIWILII